MIVVAKKYINVIVIERKALELCFNLRVFYREVPLNYDPESKPLTFQYLRKKTVIGQLRQQFTPHNQTKMSVVEFKVRSYTDETDVQALVSTREFFRTRKGRENRGESTRSEVPP